MKFYQIEELLAMAKSGDDDAKAVILNLTVILNNRLYVENVENEVKNIAELLGDIEK